VERDRPREPRQNRAVVPRRPDDATLRRFALTGPPDRGHVHFADGEVEHAQRVLRLGAGDPLIGLDGVGGLWPLVVTRAEARVFEVEVTGEPEREPAPGEPGAALPWIEVCVPLPRGERAESMVERLVQLGAAAIRPLRTERATPEARGEGSRRAERLVRTAREACKQSGRAWMPEIQPPEALAQLAQRPAATALMLDPRASESALEVLAASPLSGTAARPIRLWIGPEGGFSPAESACLDAAGARRLRLAPHVLRIETAAEAGLAVVVAAVLARAAPG